MPLYFFYFFKFKTLSEISGPFKGAWTKEEDEQVLDLVRKYGPKRWTLVAQHLQGISLQSVKGKLTLVGGTYISFFF